MTEEPLAGGRTTFGVVRVDDTVRRPSGANSAFVRDLLAHLERAGFEGAPRFLGLDEAGRECFSFIDGAVPAELGIFEDEVLVAAARLIRAYHDAAADFTTAADVICHNDLSPCNAVFQNGMPAALIDFDAAAPGTRLWDLGYAAWLWLDIGDVDIPRDEQERRLRLFIRGYDPLTHERDVVAAMVERQRTLGAEEGNAERIEWAISCLKWTLANLAA